MARLNYEELNNTIRYTAWSVFRVEPGALGDDRGQAASETAGYLDDANEGGTVVPLETIEDAHDRATALIDESFPAAWKESSDEADYDLIQISLDQMEAAVSAGQPQTAEQARRDISARLNVPAEIVDVREAAELGARMGTTTDVLDALAAPVGVLLRDRKAA